MFGRPALCIGLAFLWLTSPALVRAGHGSQRSKRASRPRVGKRNPSCRYLRSKGLEWLERWTANHGIDLIFDDDARDLLEPLTPFLGGDPDRAQYLDARDASERMRDRLVAQVANEAPSDHEEAASEVLHRLLEGGHERILFFPRPGPPTHFELGRLMAEHQLVLARPGSWAGLPSTRRTLTALALLARERRDDRRGRIAHYVYEDLLDERDQLLRGLPASVESDETPLKDLPIENAQDDIGAWGRRVDGFVHVEPRDNFLADPDWADLPAILPWLDPYGYDRLDQVASLVRVQAERRPDLRLPAPAVFEDLMDSGYTTLFYFGPGSSLLDVTHLQYSLTAGRKYFPTTTRLSMANRLVGLAWLLEMQLSPEFALDPTDLRLSISNVFDRLARTWDLHSGS